MNLRDFYFSLSRDERVEFARRAGYAPGYLGQRLFPVSGPPKRWPRLAGVLRLAAATGGAVSESEALAYFRMASPDDRPKPAVGGESDDPAPLAA